MGQPQHLKKPLRFIPTAWETVSAYRFIFPPLSLGKLLMLWYAPKAFFRPSQPNLSCTCVGEGGQEVKQVRLMEFTLNS